MIENLKVGLDEDLEEKLQWLSPGFDTYRIRRQSVDARRPHSPHFVYSVELFSPEETPPPKEFPVDKVRFSGSEPLIVGSGPAGLFAALRLVERGIPCQLFERGSPAEKRLLKINRFWRYGELNSEDNVCFGEGGAGLYSDGKLITRIRSPYIEYVMNRLVKFGAPAEIEYLANPHVGSDRIRRVIPKIRQYLLENGCKIHFNTLVSDLIIENSSVVGLVTQNGQRFHSNHVILATGHSAGDIFEVLEKNNVFMEGKSFAMGLRVEHPQKTINRIQYREAAEHPKLGAANYQLTHHNKKDNVGVYSFCMCPGGYTISSGTEADGIVCNGMSNYHRNSPFANSAIVISIDFQKWFGDNLFAGMEFRRKLETEAFRAVQAAGGTKQIPAQKITDFLKERDGETLPSSSPSGVVAVNLSKILPEGLRTPLIHALEKFEKKMPGFISEEGQLHGVESRTSCPIRVTRDKVTLQSLSHKGLYPVGEGAGYAGGITSAAVDGIRAAEAIVQTLAHQSV